MGSKSWLKQRKENTTKLSDLPDSQLLFKGKTVKVKTSNSPFGFSRLVYSGEVLNLSLASTLREEERADFCRNQVTNWLKSQARKSFNEEVFQLCNRHNLQYKNVALKDTVSRWGSCSGQKNLNFNWRLIMAPEDVLRYVVVHETAHLEELNHSSRFWSLVRNRCPEFETHRHWLKKNGAILLNWRPVW